MNTAAALSCMDANTLQRQRQHVKKKKKGFVGGKGFIWHFQPLLSCFHFLAMIFLYSVELFTDLGIECFPVL